MTNRKNGAPIEPLKVDPTHPTPSKRIKKRGFAVFQTNALVRIENGGVLNGVYRLDVVKPLPAKAAPRRSRRPS
jgi:hypothetical protein